ncbi:hypothetical protein JOY44_30910 (plasmid) [Phormidium sp. CLA17]|uniref:hypothetical protein n=1 Tax=Leptolyngbya sp. Cla-17 TaxID=2803751 RepID=UPI001931EBE3|nr:hypothetical protein [Leptolyngbya sp. Cla-17]MBM0745786.1 hypothetical protein [Leptolyngbya sp. Cla-17]
MNSKLNSSISCTALQIRVLWLHYHKENMPTTVPYVQFLWQLQQQLGVEKLREAIALIPNNPNRLNVPLASDLKVLDAFYAHPQAFEPLPDSALDWGPEILYQDGERGIIRLEEQLYGYQTDDIN